MSLLYIVSQQTHIYRSSEGERKRKRDELESHDEQPPSQPKKFKSDCEPALTVVPFLKTINFPYRSVGILEYTKVSKCGRRRDSCSTAWVVDAHASGCHIVITAAHSLKHDNEKAVNIQFIPGFNPDFPGSPPDRKYKQIPGGEGTAWAVHPEWDPTPKQGLAEYDIGVIHLEKHPKYGYIDNVTPIQMLLSLNNSDSKINTRMIGYSYVDKKMYEQEGTFYRMSRSGRSFYSHGKVPKGSSGGPMISDHDNSSGSCGVIVGNVKFNNDGWCVQSPYFNLTIDELVNLLFPPS